MTTHPFLAGDDLLPLFVEVAKGADHVAPFSEGAFDTTSAGFGFAQRCSESLCKRKYQGYGRLQVTASIISFLANFEFRALALQCALSTLTGCFGYWNVLRVEELSRQLHRRQ